MPDRPERIEDWLGKQEFVATDKMFPDTSYQRPEITHHVAEIAADFDQVLFGAVILSARPRARYAIIDGFQRWNAARRLGIEVVPATVHRGLSIAQEADKFVKLQRRRLNVKPVFRYKAELVAQHEWAVQTERVLKKFGISVVYSSGKEAPPEALAAVVALEWIYDRYGSEGLEAAFAVIVAAWPGVRGRFKGEILKSVAQFMHVEQPEIPALIELLGDPQGVIGSPDELMRLSASLRNAETGGSGLGGGSIGYTVRIISIHYRKLIRRQARASATNA